MSSTVHYPLPDDHLLLVKTGDEITPKTVIARSGVTFSDENIEIAEILQVKPAQISKYLKIGVGESVVKGQIIAEKKSLFSLSIIKSPFDGKLKEVDLKKGILTVISGDSINKTNFSLPFCGKISAVTKEQVDITVEGKVVGGIKGQGTVYSGKKFIFKDKKLKVLDALDETEGAVICCQEIEEDAIIKLDCLGVLGLILLKSPKSSPLPWMLFEEKEFKEITLAEGKNICVLVDSLQAVVYL